MKRSLLICLPFFAAAVGCPQEQAPTQLPPAGLAGAPGGAAPASPHAAPANPHGAAMPSRPPGPNSFLPPAPPTGAPAAPAQAGAPSAAAPAPMGAPVAAAPAAAPAANPHAGMPGMGAGGPGSMPQGGVGTVIPGQRPAGAVPQAGGGGVAIAGTVAEAHHVKGYTYLLVKEPAGTEAWTAVLKDESIKVGAKVQVGEEIWMQSFQSPSLNRTFDKILFGRLISKQ